MVAYSSPVTLRRASTIRRPTWKRDRPNNDLELYGRENDPDELLNLANQPRTIVN